MNYMHFNSKIETRAEKNDFAYRLDCTNSSIALCVYVVNSTSDVPCFVRVMIARNDCVAGSMLIFIRNYFQLNRVLLTITAF